MVEYPNQCHVTDLLVVDLRSSLAYFMMTHPLLIAGKLLIETLVVRQLPTHTHTHIHTHAHSIENIHVYYTLTAFYTHVHTLIPASQSLAHIFILSSRRFFCPEATITCVSTVRTAVAPATFALASMMEKILSMPMLSPTQGTCFPRGSNMPTNSSYRPPAATEPTAGTSVDLSLGSPEHESVKHI